MTLTPTMIESIEAEMDSCGLRDVYDILVDGGNSPRMAAMRGLLPPSTRMS